MHPAIRAKARSRADCHTRTPAPVVHARVAARATADNMLMHKQAASPHMRMLRIVQVRFRYIYANLLFSHVHTYGCSCKAGIHIPPPARGYQNPHPRGVRPICECQWPWGGHLRAAATAHIHSRGRLQLRSPAAAIARSCDRRSTMPGPEHAPQTQWKYTSTQILLLVYIHTITFNATYDKNLLPHNPTPVAT